MWNCSTLASARNLLACLDGTNEACYKSSQQKGRRCDSSQLWLSKDFNPQRAIHLQRSSQMQDGCDFGKFKAIQSNNWGLLPQWYTCQDRCVGFFAFLWGWKWEKTGTWFGLLDTWAEAGGIPTGALDGLTGLPKKVSNIHKSEAKNITAIQNP